MNADGLNHKLGVTEQYLHSLQRRELDHLSAISPICADLRNRLLRESFPMTTPKSFSENLSASEAKMEKECKVAVNIPVHAKERNLLRTLEEYAKQVDFDGNFLDPNLFEVNLLINAKDTEKFDESLILDQIRIFRERNPSIKVNIYHHRYKGEKATISQIRADLANIVLARGDEGGVNTGKVAIVTNDADAIQIANDYIARIIKNYEDDPDLKIQIGAVDYPREEYFSNHLLLATNRFIQFFETILRYKNQRFSMRGGNSVILAETYAEAGGYNTKKKKRENLKLYRHVRDTYGIEGVKVDRRLKITTNARRAIHAIAEGCLAEQHRNFGKEGDFADDYLVSEEALVLPKSTVKITNVEFDKFLTSQIMSLYQKYKGDMRYMKGRAQKDLSLWERIDKETESLNQHFKKAAFFLGIEIEIIPSGEPHEYEIRVIDLKKAKKLILDKFNYV